jgi:hypothetical protein
MCLNCLGFDEAIAHQRCPGPIEDLFRFTSDILGLPAKIATETFNCSSYKTYCIVLVIPSVLFISYSHTLASSHRVTMPIFTSQYPPINRETLTESYMYVADLVAVPQDQTIWQWIFESPKFDSQTSLDKIGGYVNTKTNERLNYRQVKEMATYLSTALYEYHNVRAGDRVIIFSKNSIWYPVAMFGTVRLGGIASGASPFYSVDEMNRMIQVAQPTVVFTSLDGLPVALSSAKSNGLRREQVLLLEGKAPGIATLENLISRGRELDQTVQALSYQLPSGKTNGDVCAFLGFSSGTTGLPKGVC